MSAPAGGEDALLGTDIGRFRLVRLLGKGGMGRVYLGVHAAIGSRVAIKVLAEELAASKDLVERFFTEARAVNLIHHEGIAAIIDLDALPNGRPYIVMELVDGWTLRRLLEDAPLPLGGVVGTIVEVLHALAAAHEAGVIHRDLKPDNVILTRAGRAKILDFGIAKLVDRSPTRTATGVTMGTPQYMAPEQVLTRPCDARTDIYAVGIMLFELVTGRRPFEGASEFETLELQLRGERPSPLALRPDLPPALAAIIAKAIAIAPEERFQRAEDMAAALEAARAAGGAAVYRPFSAAQLEPVAPTSAPVELSTADTLAAEAPAPVRPNEVFRETRPMPGRSSRRWIGVVIALVAAAAAAVVVVPRLLREPPVVAVMVPVDAAVAIDAAIPVDAAVAIDAAIPVRAKPARPAAARSCTVSSQCPHFECQCKAGRWPDMGCERGLCKEPATFCATACKQFQLGAFTGQYRILDAVTDADCAAAAPCKADGRCTYREDGADNVCVRDCRETAACKRLGRCTDGPDHTCVAASDADCEASTDCARTGRCTAGAGACVLSAAGCRKAEACAARGLCDFDGSACSVGTEADCRASRACARSGYCSPGADRCVPASAEACAGSKACAESGACVLDGERCVTSDESCRASAACRRNNQCRAAPSRMDCVR